MSNLVNVGDFIRLIDEEKFIQMHVVNSEILNVIGNSKRLVTKINSAGDIIIQGDTSTYRIYEEEIKLCFEVIPKNDVIHGTFKIILTYQDGNTIEEEGVTSIEITSTSVSYTYNRKKLGFIKYSGEISLELKDLKQITFSTQKSEHVFHIEKGVVIREHIMYDNERKFKSFRVGD